MEKNKYAMSEFDSLMLAKKSIKGILALISRTFVLNIISFIASIIIFSILTPRDVGIYTAVIAIQRIISFFSDIGFGAALIQKREELTKEDLVTSFTVQAILTLSIFLFVFTLSQQITSFFKLDSSGSKLLLALTFSVFLSSFKTIPSILLERKIEFQKLVIPQMTESVVFNVVLIIFVLNGFGIDSFTVAFLGSSIVSIPIYYYVAPWSIKLGISKKSLSHLRFGFSYQLKNILATLKDDLLTVLLTKFLSFTEIGYIGFAQRLSFFIFRYIVDSVTKVTFSTYSRMQDRIEVLKTGIEKSLFFVSSIMFPVLFGLIITGSRIITYFPKWQGKWEPAIVSLVFFSLNALISSLSGILVNVLDSTGRVKTTLKLMVVWTILTWVMTLFLISFYGFNGVAIASFLVTTTIIITIQLVKKQVVEFQFIKSIRKPFISSIFMSVCVYLGIQFFVYNFLSLLIVSILGGLLYILLLYSIAKDDLLADLKIFSKV